MSYFTNSLLTIRFVSGALAANREKGACHRYVKKIAATELRKSHELNDGSISRTDYLKIQWYMVTTLYLGKLLSQLRPEKLTPDEKRSLIYLGALMAVTDLMVDDHQLEKEKLIRLMTNEQERKRNDLSAIERILLLYYQQLLTVIDKDKKKMIHDFSLLKPQIESHNQHSGNITESEAMEHTRRKGGSALLMVASLLFNMTEQNKVTFYQLGVFIQLMNDSQDLPKDIRSGITTFISFQNSYEDIRQILEEEFKKTAILFSDNDFPEKGVYRLLFNFHALLTGIAFKLHRYSDITGNTIDSGRIQRTDKTRFRIHMFSLNSMTYCLPKILKFDTNFSHA